MIVQFKGLHFHREIIYFRPFKYLDRRVYERTRDDIYQTN